MQSIPHLFLSIGGILLLGLLTDLIGRRTFLPRVTLLLLFGIIIGPQSLDLIPELLTAQFETLASVALLMVGFLIGGKLNVKSLRQATGQIIGLSIGAVLGTIVLVVLGLLVIGVPFPLAVLLGCIAAATDPAATVDTILETNHKGFFSKLLVSIVALDDAWGLIMFSLGLALVATINGGGVAASLMHATHEVGGAILLGVVLGLPAAYLTGRIKKGQPMLTEALGLVLLCGGLALWLEVSYLIASIVLGAMIVNLARHHDYPFHAIENIEWPFMVIFFVLAGASLQFHAINTLGLIGLTYVVCRIAGKIVGAAIGGQCCGVDKATQRWMGLALLPQAGAAMGMALVAANQFPEYRQTLLTIVISTTVLFELIGPIFTRLALSRNPGA